MDFPQSITQLDLGDAEFARQLEAITAFSDFAGAMLRVHGDWLAEQWSSGALSAPTWSADLEFVEAGFDSLDEQLRFLRRVRGRGLLALLWRDFAGTDTVEQTLQGLSDLADALVSRAVAMAQARLIASHGQPRDAAGRPQGLVVLGLGKLGGQELNFSSDIDLIFAYPAEGQTEGRRPVSVQDFFSRVVRQVVDLLHRVTADGRVYRVDLRLRPFGEAGRQVLNFSAMEQYYQRSGRDWERYALIKARPVAGDLAAGHELLERLQPFVYRRYLDYGAYEALREMKALIDAKAKDAQRNLKLGPGGIRELEFMVQAMQLVRGGSEPALRSPRLLPTLAQLPGLGLMEETTAAGLAEAYRFLRRVENRLQQAADQQTHELPESCERLATACGKPDASAFEAELSRHRALVQKEFIRLLAGPETVPVENPSWRAWQEVRAGQEPAAALDGAGLKSSEDLAAALARFRQSGGLRSAGEKGVRLIDQLLPRILDQVVELEHPGRALAGTLDILAAVASRTAYLALLSERPAVLKRVLWAAGVSPWLVATLKAQPGLMDDLIAPEPSEDAAALEDLLKLATQRAGEDAEQQLMALVQVQRREMLALAVEFLTGTRPGRDTARRLSALAQGIVVEVLSLCRSELSQKYGLPRSGMLEVLAYGTFGGREMRFDSDLDLVFLSSDDADDDSTDGANGISTQRFFTRLTQRLVGRLSANSALGRLYEVDTRLRPNGNSGFLLSSATAFARYQSESAWVWEWQALTRARALKVDAALARRFDRVRLDTIRRPRDRAALAQAIAQMRGRMQRETPGASRQLKFAPGARLDVEFLTQYLVLAFGQQHAVLAEARGTADTLRVAGEVSLLKATEVAGLTQAYDRAVEAELRQSLGLSAAPPVPEDAAAVSTMWQHWFAPSR
ncbi:MAG: bifunctional [glutamate--ammonia ligase]-adenylyl-L-tyrosine phosphorylase/[glutamate--ammonia-ligase] adenylyltransferase [Pseudomonadota bacterium]